VEAGEGSGALHTANWAFEQQRDVFAIPGSIFSRQSNGTNQLIRESTARLVSTPEQLLEEINLLSAGRQLPLGKSLPEQAEGRTKSAPPPPVASAEEGRVLHWLQDGARHVDEIARASGMGVAEVSGTLQVMELKGMVRQERPMVYGKV
jgi:DNA processing protein